MSLDITPFLRPERVTLLELLADLDEDDWSRPTECPAWTVKGLALHILGDDLSLLSRQRDASTDSLTLYALDHPGATFRELLDGFNEQWVTSATFLSARMVIDLLDAVGQESADFYETVGLDTIAREPVQFFVSLEPSPYWQVIAREYAERFIHQSQIRRALDLPELDGDLVSAAACIHAHLLAAWMRDHVPDDGATIAFVAGTAGRWTLTRTGSGWEVTEGDPDAQLDADAVITVADDAVVRFVGRGLDAADLPGVVTFSGDEALARAGFDPIASLLARPT